MIVSEKEARTKWCPHARLGAMPGCNRKVGRDEFEAASARCIASECMAWKWKQYHSPEERKAREPNGLAVETPLGYCGL